MWRLKKKIQAAFDYCIEMYRDVCMDTEPPSNPIPIRFSGPTTRRIKAASKKSNLTQAAIIRLGVLTILPQIEAGTLRLPNSKAA